MADTSYPLQVVLALVDHLSRPWGETLDRLSHSQNQFLTLGARLGSVLLSRGHAVMHQAFEAGEDLERSFNQTRAATGASEEEMLARRRELVQVGRETMEGTLAAARAVNVLTHSGNSLAEAFELATPALQLADVAQQDVASSARGLDRLLDAYGEKAAAAAKDADLLARASLLLGEPIPAVQEALASLGATAQALHVPLATVVEMLGAVHTRGMTAATAATKVRGALFALNKEGWTDANGVLQVDAALDALKERGLSAADAMDKFGQRGGPGLGALLTVGTGGLRAIDTELERYLSLSEQQRVQNEGLVGVQRQLSIEWTNFLLKIGTTENLETVSHLLKELVPVVEALSKGVGWLTNQLDGGLAAWERTGRAIGKWWQPERFPEPDHLAALGVRDTGQRTASGAPIYARVGAPVSPTGPGSVPAKSEVTIKLKGFPKGTSVEQKGDVSVETDLGLAMPTAGGRP